MKVYLKGLNSCVNRKRDLDRYRRFLGRQGHELVETPEESELTLLWTCAFRRDYHDNSLRNIVELRDRTPELVVCGCLPDIDEGGLEEVFDGKYFSWRNESAELQKLFGGDDLALKALADESLGERNIAGELEEIREAHPDKKVLFADQFVKLFVSEGCTFKCTYCAEILAFPPHRSFPVEALVSKCAEMVAATGQHKVVLWADSLGDYGKDIGTSLPELIRALLKGVDGISLGLEHLHPARFLEYFDELMGFIRDGSVWLVDIPIQSASDEILRLMSRQYTRAGLERIFGAVQGTQLANIKTHIIAGFPGEDERAFLETVDFINRYRPKSVLISGYMESPGMPSAQFGGKVPEAEIRARVLRAAEQFQAQGIVCNYDSSSISQEHFAKSFMDLASS